MIRVSIHGSTFRHLKYLNNRNGIIFFFNTPISSYVSLIRSDLSSPLELALDLEWIRPLPYLSQHDLYKYIATPCTTYPLLYQDPFLLFSGASNGNVNPRLAFFYYYHS